MHYCQKEKIEEEIQEEVRKQRNKCEHMMKLREGLRVKARKIQAHSDRGKNTDTTTVAIRVTHLSKMILMG